MAKFRRLSEVRKYVSTAVKCTISKISH